MSTVSTTMYLWEGNKSQNKQLCISSKQLDERIMGNQEGKKKEDKNQPPV